MKLSETSKGYMATVAITFIIGFSFLFVKISLAHAHPLDALAHRFGIAFLALLPIAIWGRNKLLLKKEDLSWGLFMALLYPTLTFGLQIWALSYISSAEAGLIHAVFPLMTMAIAALVLKEKISLIQALFAMLSVFGVVFIPIMLGAGSDGSVLGYILMLISSLALSSYGVFARKLRGRFTPFSLAFFCIALGALFFNLLAAEKYIYSESESSFLKPLLSLEYIVTILYLGVFSSSLTLILSNYSYARVEASKLGIFANFVPVVAIFAGVTILGDSITWIHIVSSILIFIGVLGVNWFKKK